MAAPSPDNSAGLSSPPSPPATTPSASNTPTNGSTLSPPAPATVSPPAPATAKTPSPSPPPPSAQPPSSPNTPSAASAPTSSPPPPPPSPRLGPPPLVSSPPSPRASAPSPPVESPPPKTAPVSTPPAPSPPAESPPPVKSPSPPPPPPPQPRNSPPATPPPVRSPTPAVSSPPPPPKTNKTSPVPASSPRTPSPPSPLAPPPNPPSSSPPRSPPPPPAIPSPNSTSSSPPPPKSNTPKSVSRPSPPPKRNATVPSPSSSNSSLSPGLILGVTAAVGLSLLCVALLIFCLISKKKKKQREHYYGGIYGPPRPPPGNGSMKSDGSYSYYSGQSDQNLIRVSPSPPPSDSSGYFGAGNRSPSIAGSTFGNTRSTFSYEELAAATNGFLHENVLGEGGFGCVYKGTLSDGRVVAVKQLKVGSGQGEREFCAEVETISRIHHRHLVSLVGYCILRNQRLLVYDYVPNGTLEHHLHGRQVPPLDWATRIRVAVGAARGLAYLHEDCHPRIIHRDIKSANILLDENFEAQVADFGLAKMNVDTNTHVSTRVMGTFGYLAPEYAASGKLTEKSDVYSFGVVLLELLTGRKPVDASQPLGDESLVEWARPLLSRALEEGNLEEILDPKLENNYDDVEVFRMVEVAAACVRHSSHRRPKMGQVLRALENITPIADLNNGFKPGQSVMFDPSQQSAEIRRFRRMAFGSQEFSGDYSDTASDYGTNRYSSEYKRSRDFDAKNSRQWGSRQMQPAFGPETSSSGDSETRPFNKSQYNREEDDRSSDEVPSNFRKDSISGR